jgi:hypothetical protein
MADEAFALSPISARATQPREEDYEAIREAFMETSRGRWFLGEYARRNRNTDTRMVLDAVARIEENLAAQKQAAPDHGLTEALVAIRSAVDEARAAGLAALDGLALEPSLAPVRKGARVIREISWRLREIGADGRICDLIDSQVSAIEAGCRQIASADGRSGLSAAFDLLDARIEALDDNKPPVVEDPISSPWAAPPDETPAAAVETAPPPVATNAPETASHGSASSGEAVVAAPDIADVPADLADAHDEAVLDMIAFEMSAVDPSDIDDPGESEVADIDGVEIGIAAPPHAEPKAIMQVPEPAAEPAMAPAIQSREPSLMPSSMPSSFERPLEPSLESSPEASLGPSLGATLIANGIVRRRQALASDPLAAIRRLSQVEKIALFS